MPAESKSEQTHLVVLMAGHNHEADVGGWKGALEQRDALTTRKSHTSLVRGLAHRANTYALVVQDNTDLGRFIDAHALKAEVDRFPTH